MSVIFGVLLTVLALFLILLVLVQRGRGGGLTGALGGMGGSSAFGAKAGDVFTRITIVTASIWIVVCAAAVYWANNKGDRLGSLPAAAPASSTTEGPGLNAPATRDTKKGESAETTTTTTSEPASSEPAATESAAPATTETPATETPAQPQ